jgi:hypothetical protein
MDLISRYALKVKLYKHDQQAVFIQALLCELLSKSGTLQTTLVQGYCTVYGDSCYHIWLEDEHGSIVDITKKLFKEFDIPDFTVTKDVIEGAHKDQLTADMFELYQNDTREFWKKASKKFLDFRAKCHAQISKTGHL